MYQLVLAIGSHSFSPEILRVSPPLNQGILVVIDMKVPFVIPVKTEIQYVPNPRLPLSRE